eukprot:gb/GECH01003647.1/.p1 GENE.gb/GECH01003647.1/~~gb/GECH01003647.1/.p1  ORF type:complete len:352 (+),score=62.47 gb/GECH01003647.1/:1-1056(+)
MCLSLFNSGDESRNRDRRLNKLIKNYQRTEENEVKLLLLGTGESGKSTIFKQARIIHKKEYDEEERRKFISSIHTNVLDCCKTLSNMVDKLGLTYADPDALALGQEIQDIFSVNFELDESMAKRIKTFWEDAAVQQAFDRRAEFQLFDSCAYFLNDIERLGCDGYVPNQTDVLRCRVKTTAISEMEFTIEKLKFRIVDVGGQRTERRKWIHAFDNVTGIIFVVSLSEYDQRLRESKKTNRMMEALSLFDEMCNSVYFKDTPCLIFFNKSDLFDEKIKHTDLKVCFPDYNGGCDRDAAIDFIIRKFSKRNRSRKRTIYTRVTCATDTESMQVVFAATKTIILEAALESVDLM